MLFGVSAEHKIWGGELPHSKANSAIQFLSKRKKQRYHSVDRRPPTICAPNFNEISIFAQDQNIHGSSPDSRPATPVSGASDLISP